MNAIVSDCGRYRYALSRNLGGPPGKRVLFVMLNPSTADAFKDDPTIRRCMGYATAWGFGELEVCNLFAWRSKHPTALPLAADPIGPDNDRFMATRARNASLIVVAWGASVTKYRYEARARDVLRLLREQSAVGVFALKPTKDGQPCHPLMLRADLKPFPFKGCL